MSKAVAAAATGSLLLAGAASAATVDVDNFSDGQDDDGACTLREAVQATNTDSDINGSDDCDYVGAAGNADTINLDPNSNQDFTTTYNIQFLDFPDFGEDANQKGDFDIQAGTAGLTIQGAGTGATRSAITSNGVDRILHILSTNPGPVTVNGVVLNDGRADHVTGEKGGGILNDGGNLTVTGSDFYNSIAGAGGAALETNGTAATQITDSSFRVGNMCCDSTTTGGGGIGVSTGGGGSVTITNTEIGAPAEGNQAQSNGSPARGGGISFAPASSTTLTVTDSRIVNNDASTTGSAAEGGGVYIGGPAGSTVNFTRTLIRGNDASGFGPTDNARGGGVYLAAGGPGATFTDSWIELNSTFTSGGTSEGGGIYNGSTSTARVVGTTLSQNNPRGVHNLGTVVLLNSTVSGNGGGLAQASGAATVVNSTFAENDTGGDGGNLSQTGGTLTVRGSISADDVDGDDDCAGTITTGGFNVATDDSCWPTAGTDLDEADAALGALEDNGGDDVGGPMGGGAVPVPTHKPDIDDSDAIDLIAAGSCTDDSATALALDQVRSPRPFDGDGDQIDECDAGSLEVAACDGVEAAIVGTNGDDATLNGTGGPDVIAGAGGDDTIDGAAGADTICGGSGDDQLTGGGGVDALFGGPGTDTILSQDGLADTIDCTGGGLNSGTVDTSPAEIYVGCDSDGDGFADFVDSCPTQAGTNNGCPAASTPPTTMPPVTTAGPTGEQAAALKKCKKKKTKKAKKKCRKKAKLLPV